MKYKYEFDPDSEICLECGEYCQRLEDEEMTCGENNPVYVTMTMIDEYGQHQSVCGSFDFGGNRSIEEGDALASLFESFLMSTEFYRLVKEKDVRFVDSNY